MGIVPPVEWQGQVSYFLYRLGLLIPINHCSIIFPCGYTFWTIFYDNKNFIFMLDDIINMLE